MITNTSVDGGSADDGYVVETFGLTKRFGERVAVDGVDFAHPARRRIWLSGAEWGRQDDADPDAARPDRGDGWDDADPRAGGAGRTRGRAGAGRCDSRGTTLSW